MFCSGRIVPFRKKFSHYLHLASTLKHLYKLQPQFFFFLHFILGKYSKIIIIHDALRPFVPVNFLEKLVLEANEHGASGSIRPLVSTVIKPDKDYFINESLNRSEYVASETPQAFKFDLLEKSYSEAS